MRMNLQELRNKSQKAENRWCGILLSLDPGHTTGYCVWELTVDSIKILEAGQTSSWVNSDLSMKGIEDVYARFKPTMTVMETYQIYEWKSADHSWSQIPTVQIIGAIKYLCQQLGVPYTSQTAQVAKQFCTDPKLEEWGYWYKGLRHARDAIRHGAYYILFGNKK